MGGNFLVIPDLHIPFEHRDALAFVLAVDRMWFPTRNRTVVCLGDEIDSHSISKHMPDPDGRSPRDELEAAKRTLGDWYAAFDTVYLCDSNHTRRPWKRAYEVGLPNEFMRSVAEVYKAPAQWKWADRWVIDGVAFEHGENVSGPMGALNAALQNHMPTCIGHLHTFGGVVHAEATESKGVWGMNCGCLIDVQAYAFNYAKTFRKKPTIGCGVIKNNNPYFIPMRTGPDNRWLNYV
jgi:hypothetical protein